jgi:hypothetical protein
MHTLVSAARFNPDMVRPEPASTSMSQPALDASAANAAPPLAHGFNQDFIASLPDSEFDVGVLHSLIQREDRPYSPNDLDLAGARMLDGVVTQRDMAAYSGAYKGNRLVTQREANIYIDAHTPKFLADAARRAGLAESEVQKLESILKNSKDPEADAKLVRDLLATENPARALRTFNDLDVYRRHHPDRITPAIVRSLALGVGQARTTSSQGNEGILGNASAINAAEALVRMSPADYRGIRDALSRAGGGVTHPADSGSDAQKEKALILKAVAARMERFGDYTAWNATQEASPACDEVVQFAEVIRGRNAATLMDLTSAIDLKADGMDSALQQKWQMSCVQTTLQLARAESDPVYALWLHSDVLHNTSTTGAIADEQKAQLEAAGGRATARGTSGAGTSDDAWTALSNTGVSPSTGRAYEQRQVEDSAQGRTYAVDYLEQLVKTGTDVPIRVDWNGGGSHGLLVTDVRGTGANREFLVTDPWTGRTDWIRRDAIVNGNTNFFAGTGKLTSYWW